MKKLLCFVLCFAMLAQFGVVAMAGGEDFYCYWATEEKREGLDDSIGAASLRFIPSGDTEMYLVDVYKDGIHLGQYEEFASTEDDYGFFDFTDVMLENGNGSYTGKVSAVNMDDYLNGGENPLIDQTPMSGPYVYTEPAFTMEPVTNVRMENGNLMFDHNNYGVKTTYQTHCYIEYGNALGNRFYGHQRFKTGMLKDNISYATEAYARELARDKEMNREMIKNGDPKLVFVISAKAWDINVAKQSPKVYFYPNGEKATYTEGIPEKKEVVMTTSQNARVAFASKIAFLEAYNIYNNNYMKLHDLAAELTEMGFPIDVTWDGANNAINLITGQAYTFVGGENKVADSVTHEAVPTSSAIYLNGKPIELKAYTIGGNNFFKLRDICSALNIGVNWNQEQQLITVDHTLPYSDI